jgi:ATP-dependent phosphoenolpyruvate carboxykinase
MATTAPTRSPALGRHVRANLSTAELYEDAIRHGEGLIAADGPLVVRTGKHTGRSPEDKFIVDERSSHDKIWWGAVNRPTSEANYERLRARVVADTATEDLHSDQEKGDDNATNRTQSPPIEQATFIKRGRQKYKPADRHFPLSSVGY